MPGAEDALYTHGYCPACLNHALTELALLDLRLGAWLAPRPPLAALPVNL